MRKYGISFIKLILYLICNANLFPLQKNIFFCTEYLHLCCRTDAQGQVVVSTGQNVFGQDHQIIVQTNGDGTETTIDADQLVATAHQTLANSLNMSSQEFAEQLARVVAEAAGSGNPGQVTVSIAPSAKVDETGTVSVSIPEFEDSASSTVLAEEAAVFNQDDNASTLMAAQQLVETVNQAQLQQLQSGEICTTEQGESILIQKDGEDNLMIQESPDLLEQDKGDSQQSNEQTVFAVDGEGQQVLVSVDENLTVGNQTGLTFQSEQSQQDATEEFVTQISMNQAKNDANIVETIESENDVVLKSELELGQLEGDDSQENAQIVMMVSEDQDGEPQQVPIQIPGDQSYTSAAVLKIPTADGGHQMLIIPINSNDGGNTVLTLPQGFTLGGEDSADGNITLALDPSTMALDESGEPQQLMLPVDANGQINIESLLQGASIDALQQD